MKASILSSVLAFTALGSSAIATAQNAGAQDICVSPDDLSDAVTYAMPMLYDAVKGRCTTQFAASEFMSAQGDEFVAQFTELQDQAWPGAWRFLEVFIALDAAKKGEAKNPMTEVIAQMPPEALRPLIDVFILQVIKDDLTKDIKPETCSDIAEVVELLAPLPPENIGGLTAFLASAAKLDDPPVCKTSSTKTTSAQ